MENIGLALTNLFLGLCFIVYGKYNLKITHPIAVLQRNLTWLYYSSALLCMLSFLKFGFYNMPDGEIHQFIEKTMILSFGFVIYFMFAFVLTSQNPTKPRRVRALLLIPIVFYALFSFQWSSFVYSNIILTFPLLLLFFFMVKNYISNPNRQLLLGLAGLFTLSLLVLPQNYLEKNFNVFFFSLYTPLTVFSSFLLYRGLDLFLSRCGKVELRPIIGNNKRNFLTSTYMFQCFVPKTVEDIQEILKQAQKYNKSVSCQSSGYSIGGQNLHDNGILINTKKMNFIESFDSENGVIKVTPSTRWQQLRLFLHHAQKDNADAWAPRQFPSHFLDYSIGGAVSSNIIHSNRLLGTPLIKDIKAIDIIDTSGKLQHINRTLNPHLFYLAIGGYGLFGVITGIELNLSKKLILQRSISTLSIENLSVELDKHIQSGTLYFELFLNTNEKDSHFLQNGILSTYCQVDVNPQKIQLEKPKHKENLNDYWPVEPSSLLPSSIEQRMKQEQEERDRRQEKLQAEKEKSSIEYQVQVEREKKGVSQLPFGQGVVPSLQQPAAQAQGQRGISLEAHRVGCVPCPKRRPLPLNCSVSRISMWKKPLPSFLCCTA
jgi:hypothetical protein